MDDEDEILHEFDVYMNRSLSSDLCLFKFPNGSSTLSHCEEDVKVSVKPTNKLFQIEVAMNTRCKKYDRVKGERLAEVASSDGTGDRLLSKRTLISRKHKGHSSPYAGGLIRHDVQQIHLNPLGGVMQFKPSLSYFDKSDIKVKKGPNQPKEEDTARNGIVPSLDEVKAITMRFAAPDEEKQRKQLERSYAYLQQQVDSEAWVDVNYNSNDSLVAIAQRDLLRYSPTRTYSTDFQEMQCSFTNINDYLKSVCTSTVNTASVQETGLCPASTSQSRPQSATPVDGPAKKFVKKQMTLILDRKSNN